MKLAGKIITGILVVILAGLAFVVFMPGYGLRVVRSESMVPTVNMGDLIITGPVSESKLAEGQIITFELNKELITHRVYEIGETSIKTKGDALDNPDPWTITSADVVGAYLFKIPYVGYLTQFVQSRTGWFISIIVPAIILVLWLAKDIVKEALKNDSTKKKSPDTGGDVIRINEK